MSISILFLHACFWIYPLDEMHENQVFFRILKKKNSTAIALVLEKQKNSSTWKTFFNRLENPTFKRSWKIHFLKILKNLFFQSPEKPTFSRENCQTHGKTTISRSWRGTLIFIRFIQRINPKTAMHVNIFFFLRFFLYLITLLKVQGSSKRFSEVLRAFYLAFIFLWFGDSAFKGALSGMVWIGGLEGGFFFFLGRFCCVGLKFVGGFWRGFFNSGALGESTLSLSFWRWEGGGGGRRGCFFTGRGEGS